MKDYYQTLGVTKSSSAEEIKRAYRRLASQHHPDKGGDTARFQEIEEAYRVLGDPTQKQAYDNPQPQFNFHHPGFNMDEIFNMFGVNIRGGQRQASPRISLWISLEDVANGGPRVISLQVGNQASNVQIDIPAGIDDGETIRYPGLISGGQDLIVQYRIKPHATFQKDGRDLVTEIPVDLWNLILGGDVKIRDISGNELILTVPARTNPGSILRLRGRGLPASRLPGRAGGLPGDLLIRVQAKMPQTISQSLLDQIRQEQQR